MVATNWTKQSFNPTAYTKTAVNPTNFTKATINPTSWGDGQTATGALLLSSGLFLGLSDGNVLGIIT